MNVNDALGNPIIMGDLYGMSRNSNGHTTVVIGYARKVTPANKITIEVIQRKCSVYSDNVREDRIDQKSVSVLGSGLFPVTSLKFV